MNVARKVKRESHGSEAREIEVAGWQAEPRARVFSVV